MSREKSNIDKNEKSINIKEQNIDNIKEKESSCTDEHEILDTTETESFLTFNELKYNDKLVMFQLAGQEIYYHWTMLLL